MAHSRVPHLFDCWDEVSLRVGAARRICLFLDFDGTLVGLRSGPDQVNLSRETRLALRNLVRHASVKVAVISGRRRAALKRYVRVPRVTLLGLYGWEDGPRCRLSPGVARKLSQIRAAFTALPSRVPGVRIEDKGFSLAVHFRGASPLAQQRGRARILRCLSGSRADLRVIRSSDVWDVAPRQFLGKGAAVRSFLAQAGRKTLPIFVGDDLTDEAGFAAARHGIAVLSGNARPTRARFRLNGPGEVCLFLRKLEEECAEKS